LNRWQIYIALINTKWNGLKEEELIWINIILIVVVTIMSQNHFQNLLWNIGIKSDFGSYFTDKPHQRYCANHDNKATFGYYCSKCDYFICGTCVNVDIDKECLEKHLTFWCRNRDEYCFKHKGISNSGFYCIEGHFAFICDDCNNTKDIYRSDRCLNGHATHWVYNTELAEENKWYMKIIPKIFLKTNIDSKFFCVKHGDFFS